MRQVRTNSLRLTVVVVGFCLVFGFQLRTVNTRLSGDDFLLVNFWSQLPIDAKSVWDLFWLTGQDKWRPVSTVPLVLLSRNFGFNNQFFVLINIVLLSILASVVGSYTYSISKRFSVAFVSMAAVAITPFNWYGQTSLFGLMEILDILLCLLGLIFLCKYFETETAWAFALSYTFLFAASLCHERFLIVPISCWAYSLFFRRNFRRNRFPIYLLTIPLLHIFLKGFVLRIDPLTGGGESNVRSSIGPWILGHFRDSFSALFGMKSGMGIYYSDGTFQAKASASHMEFLGLVIFLPALISLVYLFLRKADSRHTAKTTLPSQLLVKSGLFLVSALALLIPSATVVERVEGRWLLAPQIFILIAFIGLVIYLCDANKPDPKFIGYFAVSFSLAIVVTGLIYRSHAKDYLAIQDQPSLAIEQLNSAVPVNEDWGVLVNQTDESMPTAWQFGYGAIFSQLKNPPSFVRFGSSWDLCPSALQTYTCFQINLNGLDPSTQISSTVIGIQKVRREK